MLCDLPKILFSQHVEVHEIVPYSEMYGVHPRTIFATNRGWKVIYGTCPFTGRSKSHLFSRARCNTTDWRQALAYRRQMVAGLNNLRGGGSLGHCNALIEDARSSCQKGSHSQAPRLVPEGRTSCPSHDASSSARNPSASTTGTGMVSRDA